MRTARCTGPGLSALGRVPDPTGVARGRLALDAWYHRRVPSCPALYRTAGLVLTLLVVSPPARARSGVRPEVQKWATAALGQMVSGDLSGAVISLGRARAAQPLAEVHALVGLAALQGGRIQDARQQLDAAIAAGSTAPEVFYWAGRAALMTGDRAGALRRLEQALTVGGDRAELRLAHALLARALGHAAEARASLARVARAEPRLQSVALYPRPLQGAVALLGLLLRGLDAPLPVLRTEAFLLWQGSEPLAALAHFTRLDKERPRDGETLAMMARCRWALGQRDQALALARQAVDVAPGLPLARAARGELLLAAEQPQAAEADLHKAADGLPRDPQVLLSLARACQETERADCARKFFGYAVERAPDLAEAHFGLALSLQQAGENEPARV